jgi:hypothetical protein
MNTCKGRGTGSGWALGSSDKRAGQIGRKAVRTPNPEISRAGGFHRQGIQGLRCTQVLQALDNAVYGSLRRARRVTIFLDFCNHVGR